MWPVDTLVSIGLATWSLGTIHESDGKREHEFWLRNVGTEPVSLVQGYTSCGCVKLTFPLGETVQPGDSVKTVLSFDPKGKGGEFYERGTIVYGKSRKRIDLVMQGECVSSEETLLKQFPVKINEGLRLSADYFDLGEMVAGEAKSRNVVVLHRDEGDRRECLTVRVEPAASLAKGVHRIKRPVYTMYKNEKTAIEIFFDILIK